MRRDIVFAIEAGRFIKQRRRRRPLLVLGMLLALGFVMKAMALRCACGLKVHATFSRPFAFDPGTEWKAAVEIPDVEPVGLFTTKQLIHWMKGRLDAGEYQQQAYNAIDKAMMPAHMMPI